VDELKDAAALLGPLLPNWHVQIYIDFVGKRGIYRFLDRDTGYLQDEDPRISESTRKLAMSEESIGSRNVGCRRTDGLTSSQNDISPHQRLEPEVLGKTNPLLQKFILF